MWERELETKQNCIILTSTLLAITTFLSRSPGLLTWGPGGPASLGAGFLYHSLISNSSDPQLINRGPEGSLCWVLAFSTASCLTLMNFLCTELYNSSKSTFFLWALQIALIQPIHGQGYTLLFLDRMHLLFTQVHFLFWQPGWVVGQYTTICVSDISRRISNWFLTVIYRKYLFWYFIIYCFVCLFLIS